MDNNEYLVLTFESTHAAMSAQKYLKGKINHAVMPVPRCISASCGIAIRANTQDIGSLRQLLDGGFPVAPGAYSLYRVDQQDCAHKL